MSIPLKQDSLKVSVVSVPSVLRKSKLSMQQPLLSSLRNSLFLSPYNMSVTLAVPSGVIHGVSIVSDVLVVSGKSTLFFYRLEQSATTTYIAIVPATVHLPPSFEVSFVHQDRLICNSKEQSQLFHLLSQTSSRTPSCRCCCVISAMQVVLGGDEGFFLYENESCSQVIHTPSAVMSLAASESALFVGCRSGVVYRWDFKTRLLKRHTRCRHAVIAMAVMDDLVCTIDAAGIVKINNQRINLHNAHCICQDDDHLLIGLRDQVVCIDWTGCVCSTLPIPNVRFIVSWSHFFVLASDDSHFRAVAKRGYLIQQTSLFVICLQTRH